jgi:hypothetical protein
MLRRRHNELTAAISADASESTAATSAGWSELSPLLDQALAALPRRLRDAVVLHHLQNLPRSAVAATLACSPDALDKRLVRALARLRSRLGRRGVALSVSALVALLTQHGGEAHAATLAPRTLGALSTVMPIGWFASLGLAGKTSVALATLALLLALGGGGYALHHKLQLARLREAALATLPSAAATTPVPSAGSESAAPSSPPAPPRSRFASSGAFAAFQRRLLQAATVDEAEAMLRAVGVTASRDAIAIAFENVRRDISQMNGRDVDGNAPSIAWPYLEFWLQEDVVAASRWILIEWPQPFDWTLDWTFKHWEKNPAVAASLLAEFANHPDFTRFQGYLLVRTDPQIALGFLRDQATSFDRFTLSDLRQTAVLKWFAADSPAAFAWLLRPENTALRLTALEASTGLRSLSHGPFLTAAQARSLAAALPPADQPRGRELAAVVSGYESLQAGQFAAALDSFRAGGPSGALRLKFGDVLATWASQEPLAAQAYVAAVGDAALTGQFSAGWARRDFAAAYDWALGVPPALREAALGGIARDLVHRDPAAALSLVAESDLANPASLRRDLLGRWADRDPAAAAAWLANRPADAERAVLGRDYALRLAYKEPERALELLARTGTAPDPAVVADLAKGLAHRVGEYPADFVASFADRPDLHRAALAGAVTELFRADPAKARAELLRTQPPAEADLTLWATVLHDGGMVYDQPAAVGALLNRLDPASVPSATFADAHQRLARYWTFADPDAALRWAADLADPALAARARTGISDVLGSPTPAQKALLDRLPTSPPK